MNALFTPRPTHVAPVELKVPLTAEEEGRLERHPLLERYPLAEWLSVDERDHLRFVKYLMQTGRL